MWLRKALAVCGLVTVSSVASTQEADVEMGSTIADVYCSRYHNIEPDGPFKLEPPAFAAIAKYRSPEQIKARIVTPIHHAMPRFTEYMIGNNVDDMVAYIVSLER